jgi:glutamyl/glutaminyl-tRNA synthetase
VPLLLGTDKKRLSKRHGATSVTEYERLGYLPDAMVNFLGLLGWSPGDDREVMSRDELIRAFTLEGISGGDAVFNPDKLDWFNTQYIAKLPPDDLVASVKPLLETAALWKPDLDGQKRPWLQRVLKLVEPRVRRLPDFVEQVRPFLDDRVDYDQEAVAKYLTTADLHQQIEALAVGLGNGQSWDEVTIERVLREVADERKIKAAVLIHAARIATTGKAVSPGIFEVLALMGQRVTVTRLSALAQFLRSSSR